MSDKYPNSTSITNVFNTVKSLVCNTVNIHNFFVPMLVLTDDGITTKIIISKSEENNFSINENILIYKNKAINISSIVKIKILIDKIPSNKFTFSLLKSLENLTIYNVNSPIDTFSNKKCINRFNVFSDDCFNISYNIQDYILKNMKNIKDINFNMSTNCLDNNITVNTVHENVLNSNTSLYATEMETLENIDLDIDTLNVVSSIKEFCDEVITDIKTEEKLVLTNNASEVEVSKPIDTEDIDVLTKIHTKNYSVAINPKPVKILNKVNQNQIESVTDINPYYSENTISNIDIQRQIIPPKTIEVLDLVPLNQCISKCSLDGKLLSLSPNGENCIGVFLDDGTFEPLKLSFKTFNVIPKDTFNLVGNIYRNQLKNSVTHLDISKDCLLQSLDIGYGGNAIKYDDENIVSIKDLINTSKTTIKNITNDVETTSVVTKNNLENINSIKNIKHDTIKYISDIKMDPVVKSIKTIKSTHDVIGDLNFDKNISSVVQCVDIVNNNISSCCENTEKICGSVNFVGNDIMIVNNENSDISIYSIPKINSVTQF
ncbi:hypothetical protein [Paraclostridium sordellii]|uniref:hypothetical protein n=1 Tax=Paraclostridium sordellii TaxID=1505 RepID=UPI0005DFEAED|nr:hypothetical protein [Paeniclostridium sordellii]CEP43167.1 Uncharacterised protein [[Clostridium] sordellii] [Paeniclostridium sordellii]CEQ17166.1 Uncharacterised protein [[Clostridium] sordellii] [Paeniclostridium sordellii]